MRRPMSPKRRKAAILAGSAAAMSGSVSLLLQQHPANRSDGAFGLVTGMCIGVPTATAFVLLARDRIACSKT